MKAIITLGLPASGKSTFLETLDLNLQYQTFDADQYTSEEKDPEKAHIDRNEQMCRDIISYGVNGTGDMIIVAASGGCRFEDTLNCLITWGYDIIILYFDTELEVCLEQNQMRDRKVPEEVIRNSVEQLRKNLAIANQYATAMYSILPTL